MAIPCQFIVFFFFNDTATTEIYTLSLHDALPISGVEVTDRGYIRVNERLQTTAPGIWAMGECAGSPHFTHVAFDDFRIVHDNLTGGNRTTQGRLVPFCLFTDPQLARVGLNESEARKLAIPY